MKPKKSPRASLSDNDLMQQFIAGNIASFGIIYGRNKKKLLKHIFSKTNNREQAEDIIQEAFLKAFEAAREGKYKDHVSVGGWLYTIARNIFINQYRIAVKSPTDSINDEEAFLEESFFMSGKTIPSVEDDFIISENLVVVNKGIGRLSQFYQDALISYSKGYEYREIAEQLECPIGSVKTAIHNGRKRVMAFYLKMNRRNIAA